MNTARAQQWSAATMTVALLASILWMSPVSVAAPPKAKPAAHPATTAAPAKPAAPAVPAGPAISVTPNELLKDPAQYLHKNVSFSGTFNSFSSLGLDYKRAFRDSKDYVSFLILRPDVNQYHIPLSELKLIYPRKKSEDIQHLEAGDKITVKGQVFSNALNEPWVDVAEVKIVSKAKPKAEKADSKTDAKDEKKSEKPETNTKPELKPNQKP